MRQILRWFFKKIVIADTAAIQANYIFENYATLWWSDLLLWTIFFAFQIYGDFSWYSDIAIGTAKLFWFNLSQNFNFPYFSRNVSEFRRRRHITLMKRFTEYIYIPLWGSRVEKIKILRNIFIVFLISGIWHWANRTFIFRWLLNAVYIIIPVSLNINHKYNKIIWSWWTFPPLKEILYMLWTFILICFSWIFFRSDSISTAFDYISHIPNWLFSWPVRTKYLFLILILVAIERIQKDKQHWLDIKHIPTIARWSIYIIITYTILFYSWGEQNFIYFQF
jgi:D-alanyl-lipoteichoic acid acyltransferase DltB (MBOAT superfamily)